LVAVGRSTELDELRQVGFDTTGLVIWRTRGAAGRSLDAPAAHMLAQLGKVLVVFLLSQHGQITSCRTRRTVAGKCTFYFGVPGTIKPAMASPAFFYGLWAMAEVTNYTNLKNALVDADLDFPQNEAARLKTIDV
jgi:hypothetical protein